MQIQKISGVNGATNNYSSKKNDQTSFGIKADNSGAQKEISKLEPAIKKAVNNGWSEIKSFLKPQMPKEDVFSMGFAEGNWIFKLSSNPGPDIKLPQEAFKDVKSSNDAFRIFNEQAFYQLSR